MSDDDLLDRRARMFDRPRQTFAGTGAPGRGVMEIPERRDPKAAVYASRSGRGFSMLGLLQDGARSYAERQRMNAQNDVITSIRDQLEPGEEVIVYMDNLDVFGGTYETVSVGRTDQDAWTSGTSDVQRVVGGKPGDVRSDDRRPPANKDFFVPTSGGWKIVSVPVRGPGRSSPSDARPGRGEMKDWIDRWNRDPGLIDHDLDRAAERGRTA